MKTLNVRENRFMHDSHQPTQNQHKCKTETDEQLKLLCHKHSCKCLSLPDVRDEAETTRINKLTS